MKIYKKGQQLKIEDETNGGRDDRPIPLRVARYFFQKGVVPSLDQVVIVDDHTQSSYVVKVSDVTNEQGTLIGDVDAVDAYLSGFIGYASGTGSVGGGGTTNGATEASLLITNQRVQSAIDALEEINSTLDSADGKLDRIKRAADYSISYNYSVVGAERKISQIVHTGSTSMGTETYSENFAYNAQGEVINMTIT